MADPMICLLCSKTMPKDAPYDGIREAWRCCNSILMRDGTQWSYLQGDPLLHHAFEAADEAEADRMLGKMTILDGEP